MGTRQTQPTFFPSAAAFRSWLRNHHRQAAELWVGFWKRATGRPSLTWSESVDEALCYGWIDGVRHRIDTERYAIRFTPRRPGSGWSAVNLRRMKDLEAAGRMTAAGRRAFHSSDHRKSGYSAADPADFDAAARTRFRADRVAWAFFRAQPPGYRRTVTGWVMSAKRPETRERRLAMLIADSAAGHRLNLMAPGRREASGNA
jgi:uncharacterized protein YdeI (YjbR/CyaY-like superfamily)